MINEKQVATNRDMRVFFERLVTCLQSRYANFVYYLPTYSIEGVEFVSQRIVTGEAPHETIFSFSWELSGASHGEIEQLSDWVAGHLDLQPIKHRWASTKDPEWLKYIEASGV